MFCRPNGRRLNIEIKRTEKSTGPFCRGVHGGSGKRLGGGTGRKNVGRGI